MAAVANATHLPCGHWFHPECITRWWDRLLRAECPMCRHTPQMTRADTTVLTQLECALVKLASCNGPRVPAEPGALLAALRSAVVDVWPRRGCPTRYDHELVQRLVQGVLPPGALPLDNLAQHAVSSLVSRGYLEPIDDGAWLRYR